LIEMSTTTGAATGGTVHSGPVRRSPAWQRHRAARTLAHHATDAADLADLLAMLGLTAMEGREPRAEATAPEPSTPPAPLDEGSAERLTDLLRDVLPSAGRPSCRGQA
jgi:hypothetical protein